MSRVLIFQCCAVVCVLASWAACARAQEANDPFGGLEGEPAAEQPKAADPATAAAEALGGEKSLLGGDHQHEHAVAHQHEHGMAGPDFCRCVGESDSAAIARIEKALQASLGPNGMDFTDTPLEEVVNLLQEEYGIPIQIDNAALDATGKDPTEPVTVNLHNISLRSALRLMLKGLKLTYIIRDEVLLITSPEEAEASLRLCVYNVRELLPDASEKSMDALIDTIVSCVSTESWAENGGGEAEIRPLKPGILVISQTQEVHEEINNLLKSIRDMRGEGGHAMGGMPGADIDEVVTRSYSLQITFQGEGADLDDQVRGMIVQSLPDTQWDGRLADGQSVLLSVLPDRVVVRHTPEVHEQLTALFTESGIAAPITHGAFGRGGVGGDGSGAGGFGRGGEGGGGFGRGEMGGRGNGGGGFFAPTEHEPAVN